MNYLKVQSQKKNNIIIAGNLSSYKVGYVYELPHDVKFDLYGINYTGVTDNKIKYHGSYPSDELPWHLKRCIWLSMGWRYSKNM